MECKLRHPIVVYTATYLILYLCMTKKILLFSMLLALGFATSCKEDMPQSTPRADASGIARRAHALGA